MAGLELEARRLVEGLRTGKHRGWRRGVSGEWAGHRPYAPGEEWRHIDWKVFARTDRWTVRERRDDADLPVQLLVDVSRSMEFSTGAVSKWWMAQHSAAALIYFLTQRHESVGLTLFSDKVMASLPLGSGPVYRSRLFELLASVKPEGNTTLSQALDDFGRKKKRRALVMVLSDLWSPQEEWLGALRGLQAQGHELWVVEILDPFERRARFRGPCRLVDLETQESLTLTGEEAEERYAAAWKQLSQERSRALNEAGILFRQLTTDIPLEQALRRLLTGVS